MNAPHLIVIDASSFMYRAFHARKPIFRKSDGVDIRCVVGFVEMIWAIQRTSIARNRERPATHMVVVFDHKSQNFRHRLDPNYKANRPPVPEDLKRQFPWVRDAARAHNIHQVEMEGHEADDIIATIVKQSPEVDIEIFTSDKDLMQLVGPYCTIWNPMTRMVMDAAAVFDKFGVWPSEMRDFLAMVGDAADNIPGLPKVGPVNAAQLIAKFQNIENMIVRLNEIDSQRVRDIVEANQEQLLLSQKLVTLNDEVPIRWDLNDAILCSPTKLGITTFCIEHDWKSHRFDVLKFIEIRQGYRRG